MPVELLPCVEIEPEKEARFSVVWLHGLGADGHDFEALVPELELDPELGVRFVFPHAPMIPVTVNGGMLMRAWYDVREFSRRGMQDEPGVERSVASVRALIQRETERGIPAERVLLAGFSQGGAIALHAALRYPKRLLGALALSTYIVCPDVLQRSLAPANRGLPIFQAHGLHDPLVPIELGRAAQESLLEQGYAVEWHAYPMQHQVSIEEIQDLSRWMSARFESVSVS